MNTEQQLQQDDAAQRESIADQLALWGRGDLARELQERQPRDELPPFHLWPENVEPFVLFLQLRTQWRTAGVDGARIGLDYGAVLDHLERGVRLPRRQVRGAYAGILACERGALQGWDELRAERSG